MNLKTKIIAGFFILTAVAAVIGAVSLYQFSVLSASFAGLPEHMDKMSDEIIALGHASKILYYDEVLTQSVRNYAFTGDVAWKNRYVEFESLLNNTLESRLISDPMDEVYFSKIANSNKHLIRMEKEVIALVDNGELKQAISVLENEEYISHKKEYAQALAEYSNAHDVNLGMTSDSLSEKTTGSLQQLRSFSAEGAIVFQISLAILVLLSIVLGYVLASSIALPFTKLQKKIKQIAKGNFDVMLKPEGPDEIRDMIIEFNNMIQELKKLDHAKRNVTSILSHELRTPLMPIMGNLEILLMDKSDNLTSEQKIRIEKTKERCLFMKKMISDIVDLNDINEDRIVLQKQVISLEDIIQNSLDAHRAEITRKNIDVQIKLPQIKIDGDMPRLIQVFSNLIANAIDFCPKTNGLISISGLFAKSNVRVTIRDNGRGLEQSDLAKIFEMYYQVGDAHTRDHNGAGIGLAVCKGIVEMHGGSIWAESFGIGYGTAIHVELPIISKQKTLKMRY
ncbi:MAG: HAMP domain-containing histidine kinase [Nitrosarchaeum sp.]|nr:HAMP domain-containing histidine kinase [Nitrosarchaeum sp.]